jgi:hypothetical protein
MDRDDYIKLFMCMSAAVLFALIVNDMALVLFAFIVLG